jgi:hypothetical protein
MGLKISNYTTRAGVVLPEAYAIVTDYRVKGNTGLAKLSIQTTRTAAFENLPIETVTVGFVPDRNALYTSIYSAAKSGYFKAWTDDIVENKE